ncbi:MAG: Two-component system sensor histidine kinase CreC, partial [Verrucomicrobiaceae bacterium]|nr:Two-component system sensor histidine kinase CreC [Verrucomicrobiaceae bacterium]
ELHKHTVGLQVYLTDARGVVLYDSDKGQLEGRDFHSMNDVRLTLGGFYGSRSTRSNPADSKTSTMHVAAPVYDGDKIIGVLTVRKPKFDQWLFIEQRRAKIQISTLFIGGGIAAFVGAVMFWVLQPLRRLTAYVQAIKNGERPALPHLRSSVEVNTLATAMEEMREELEGRDYASRYVQTLTHELKSPLAAIRATAELLEENQMEPAQRKRFLESLRIETERTEHLIRQLLRLAEVERQKFLRHTVPVDLRAVAGHALQELQPAAEAKGLNVDLHQPEASVTVEGDEMLLRRAATNLIENAIDFSPANGKILVCLSFENNQAVLSIADEGPGIPDYALPRLFERFYSLKHKQTGRKGSGLGLCFVKETAGLHHGTVTVENRPEGGAKVSLSLPATLG